MQRHTALANRGKHLVLTVARATGSGILFVRSQERQSDPERWLDLGINRAEIRSGQIEGRQVIEGEVEQFQTFVSKDVGYPIRMCWWL